MKDIEILKGIIRPTEGLKLSAYLCPAGKWTIGYGHTKGVKRGMKITADEAEKFLNDDASEALEEAIEASPILKNESQAKRAAIADFVYNFGIGKYNSSSLKVLVNRGDWVKAAEEIKKWRNATVKGKRVVMPGLVKRRAVESKLLLTNDEITP